MYTNKINTKKENNLNKYLKLQTKLEKWLTQLPKVDLISTGIFKQLEHK